MSHRPLNKKRAARVRKMLRATPATQIDLVQWLRDRRYARTTGEAERIILAGRVKSESHALGIKKGKRLTESGRLKLALGREVTDEDIEERDVVDRLVPARLRSTITVVA